MTMFLSDNILWIEAFHVIAVIVFFFKQKTAYEI
mgnify:CR=1 FL=1